MGHVRPPAVAGLFYPRSARDLDGCVRGLLADAAATTPAAVAAEGRAVKAIIAPHAGYIYSGPIAARAYACLAGSAASIERVVLIGPSHRVPLAGLAAPTVDSFATPLGRMPLDHAAIAAACTLPEVCMSDEAHAGEHALEVQLPFLQVLFPGAALVPIVVGEARTAEVAAVLARLWGGPETVIVVSSDLSHYLDNAAARRLDAVTCRAIEALDPERIGDRQACGRVPIAALLMLARARQLRVQTLDLRTSADTAGDRQRVVGYGAWAFAERAPAAMAAGSG